MRFISLVLVSSFCAPPLYLFQFTNSYPNQKVFLVILSVFFENSGFMKAGPRQSQFEPTEGKTVKFSDVHGVDEAKDVKNCSIFL